ncbi:hypothetical protein EG864_15475, partial [Enterococcus faecalis]
IKEKFKKLNARPVASLAADGRAEGGSERADSAMAERRLVAVLGQVQTYVFQLEMLKRCDPAVVRELAPRVKLNALMCRYLARRLPLEAQMTPLTCALRLALAYARAEGDRVLGALA